MSILIFEEISNDLIENLLQLYYPSITYIQPNVDYDKAFFNIGKRLFMVYLLYFRFTCCCWFESIAVKWRE